MTHFTRSQFTAALETILGERRAGRPDQAIHEVTVAQNFELDAKKVVNGSIYRYGLAGAVDLALGVLCQAPVPAAVHHDLVPLASYAIGVRIVGLTIGAANIDANEYAGGSLHVNDGTGQGQVKKILSHPAALAGATCLFTLVDPLTTALDIANSLCAITRNPYNQVIIHPAPPTAKLVGVPVAAIVAGRYGWFQTRGPCAVLTQGVLYIFRQVRPSGSVGGAVTHANLEVVMSATAAAAEDANGRLTTLSTGGDGTIAFSGMAGAVPAAGVHDLGSLVTIVGRVMRVEVDGDYSLIDLTLE